MKLPIVLATIFLFLFAACTIQPIDIETPETSEQETFTPSEPEENNADTNTTQEETTPPPTQDTRFAAIVEAVEEELIQLRTQAVDPDGGEVVLTFQVPFNQSGAWQTRVGDAGEYEIVITASDGIDTTSITVLVIVNELNLPPVIEGPERIVVNEGERIDLGIFTITDPEGDDVLVSYAGWMTTRTYTTTFDDAGIHEVRIIAEDTAGNEVVKTVAIEVINVNRAPVLELEQTRIEATEGDRVRINFSAFDPDGEEVTITFSEPVREDGVWQTRVGDAGEYTITVTVTDGIDTVTEEVVIVLERRNRAPVIILNDEIVVNEGDFIDLKNFVTIADPDGDDVVITYSGWMTSSTRSTTYGDAGEYQVTISASDGELVTTKTVDITVQFVNRPPVFVIPA